MSDAAKELIALLVDDEAYFRRFVGQVLVKNALVARVVEARDGSEGLKLFQEIHPGLILLDINMPRMNGLDTLIALRRLSATVPIIMLTSVSEEAVVEKCVEHGASFFIRKDVPAQELQVALAEALNEFARPTGAES